MIKPVLSAAKLGWALTKAVSHPMEFLKDKLLDLAWGVVKSTLWDAVASAVQDSLSAPRSATVPLPTSLASRLSATSFPRLQQLVSLALSQRLMAQFQHHVPVSLTLSSEGLTVTILPPTTS